MFVCSVYWGEWGVNGGVCVSGTRMFLANTHTITAALWKKATLPQGFPVVPHLDAAAKQQFTASAASPIC